MLNQMIIPFRALFSLPFIILLMAGTMLPSDGQHGIMSIKSLAFIFSTFATLVYVGIKQSFTRNQLKLVIFLMGSLCWLVLASLYSQWNGSTEMSSIIDQCKVFWITLSVAGMAIFFVEEELISFSTLLKSLVYFNFTYSLFKIILAVLLVMGYVNLENFLTLTGIRVMTMGLVGGLTRLQTSVDIITPFLIMFVLQSNYLGVRFNERFKVSYYVIAILAVLLSFSRVFIAIAFFGMLLHWATLSLPKILKRIGFAFVLLIAGVCLIGVDTTLQLVEKRLFSEDNYESDQTRVLQVEALMDEFAEQPLLGKGVGSYAVKNIRDTNNLHSYEVQWVAFLMQFGVVGMLVILTPLGVIYSKFFTGPASRVNTAFALLFTCWLLAGFTNPFLISLTSGIVYALFLLAGIQLQKKSILIS
jgi:hypothetical protein